MSKLSVCTCMRADDYEGDCIGRFIKSVDLNCQTFESLGIEYEYIAGEWNPPNETLYQHPKINHLFNKYNLKSYIATEESILKRGFNPDKVQEYYCKNLAIRNSIYDNLLITNSDMVFPKKIMTTIKSLLEEGLREDRYYRIVNRVQIDPDNLSFVSKRHLLNSEWKDNHLIAAYSGDFLLCSRNVMFNIAKGYDERNDNHKVGFQTSIDGECLATLYNKGILPQIIPGDYCHIWHTKTRSYDSTVYQMQGYDNVDDWGFRDFPLKEIVPNKVYEV